MRANTAGGIITDGERYNKVIDIWTHATDKISELLFKEMEPFNPIFMMADSGARVPGCRSASWPVCAG